MTTAPLLQRLTAVADQLGLPLAVGIYADSPAPDTYLVVTPLSDVFEVFADNQPGIEVEEARISVFTKANYLPVRNQLTAALMEAGLTVTARRYVGYEPDTGYHHYSIDIATYTHYRS
ncbi:hypothetical protein [Trueperella bialowiezensis]|uniref:Uncharacterized protein n=1 Tax=Trueperella bialowiezensis TaxID=312285 RepID=A0A448PG08_9ACTO|nr:hypothetical protein [Trueperella bialowiezensis]VEI13848.1 Uncharacterised protein [Trueperella bialowiezensis]